MSQHDEISLPAALQDGAVEFVRALRQPDGQIVFCVRQGVWKDPDPGIWGMLMVDLLHHAARSVEDRELQTDDGPCSLEDILVRMKEIFEKEWADRTDTATRMVDA